MLLGDVDHAVITGDHQPYVVGQRRAEPLAHSVDPAKLAAPGDRMATVDVTAVIELALVGVDQGASGARGSGADKFHALVQVVFMLEADEVGTAQGGLGQPAALKAFQRHRGDGNPRDNCPLEERRSGTPVAADRTPKSRH